MSTDRYVSPLSERYASKEMQYIFSPDMKFRTWRRLWIALAETEKELGLNITQEQIDELKAHKDDINYDVAKERERQVRHDVMSHVYAYGVQCPKAKGIIHLGATSCYVGDNTDIIVMAEALKLVQKKLVNVIAELSKFADKYKEQPTLAFTHFQPAQPTTVGKRATLWTQEFLMDLEDLEYVMGTLKLLGSKGTTGTQASFLELFEGDQETIDKIDPMIAEKMGFKNCYPVSGQTYSRKVDTRVLNILAGIAASAHKMSNDIRLLQHLKEVEEPFEKSQIGSSAMAYKRNPMRSERIASLSRYRIAVLEPHLLCDHRINLVDGLLISFKQFKEACLCTGRSLGTEKFQSAHHIFQILEIHQEFLCPKCRTLTNGRRLCRLEMCKCQCRLFFVFICKF